MQPAFIDLAIWQQIFTAVNYGFWFAGLMIASALIFLFAQALIPSLVLTAHVPASAQPFRVFLYFLSLVIAFLAILNLIRFISTALNVAGEVYPRFLI